MQTVNFNCPHCGNLMAVGTNLLGRNVRCPHCKQVIRAPAAPGEPLVQTPASPMPAPAPGLMPTFDLPKPTEHHESIFGERHDEDVFGSEPPKPKMPPAPPPVPTRSQDAETVTAPHIPAVAAPPPAYVAPAPAPVALDFSPAPTGGALVDHTAERRTPPVRAGRVDTVFHQRKGQEAGTTPAFAWILLAYAAIVTIAAGFFGYQYFTSGSKDEHPYRAMPDVIREYKPAEKRQMSFQGMPDPKLDIPKDLRVKLGGELTIGDLKVQPLYVERKDLEATTKYVSADDKKRNLPRTVVMTLRVRNLSSDTAFCPNDPAFNRVADSKQLPPYTGLQLYREYFYGTFKWPPDPGTEKEYFEGQEADEQPLKPGEERDTWVTVASHGVRAAGGQDADRLAQTIAEAEKQDPNITLLWRVQLRRGLVKMKNEAGQAVEVSATTVIGVEFKPREIKGL